LTDVTITSNRNVIKREAALIFHKMNTEIQSKSDMKRCLLAQQQPVSARVLHLIP